MLAVHSLRFLYVRVEWEPVSWLQHPNPDNLSEPFALPFTLASPVFIGDNGQKPVEFSSSRY